MQPCHAIREGTATADIFIKHYTRSADFGKLALWHEAAAECLKRISVPMNEIARDYYVRHGHKKWVTRSDKEAREIQKQYQYHRKRALVAWQQFVGGVSNPDALVGGVSNPDALVGGVSNPDVLVGGVSNPDVLVGGVSNPDAFAVLDTEREKIAKFMATWLPRYPNRFYEFGIYPTFFRKQREIAEQEGDYVKALQLEADAAEMCATQYEKIPTAYGLEGYQKHRDAYRRHAVLLRGLIQQNLKALPTAADQGKEIISSLETRRLSFSKLKAETVLHIAKSDARVKAALANQRAVHASPSFQGFVWIVRFSNHSRGNIVTAIVNEKTTKVLDVF